MIELEQYEEKHYSQGGEDGVIAEIFSRIGTTNKFYVDLGAYNGIESSNTALLSEAGWQGILIDATQKSANPLTEVQNHFITAENVNDLLRQYRCPFFPDFMSIDIDGNDFYIWQALSFRYGPRVLIIEYNGHIPPDVASVIEYDPEFRFGWTDYFGASLRALVYLGWKKGYELLYCDRAGVNTIFVKKKWASDFARYSVEELWRPLFYGPYAKDEREMMAVLEP